VIGAARGLADILWSREIEGGNYGTPERRAALEARIGELANTVRDEVVRRYYKQDLAQRLQQTFAPEPQRGFAGKGGFNSGFNRESRRFPQRVPSQGGRFSTGGRPGFAQPPVLGRGPYQASSAQMANSPIMRGQRSALSRREALILQCLIAHPWLLHDHLEEVAALELAHPEAHKLRAGIIAAFANDHHHSPDPDLQAEKMHADLEKSGFSQMLQRVERAITTSAVFGVRPGAAREDVLSTWHQLVVLHQKTHALLREKKDAEIALGEEPSDANMTWLKDVSLRLESLEGTEAQIDGFGELSGRFQKTV
jgi:DNA primase